MAINNKDIERIYKFLSGELTEEEQNILLNEIDSSPELKMEYRLQKELFHSFENDSEQMLGSYLNQNHTKFLWFSKLYKFRFLVGIIIVLITVGLFFFIQDNKEIVRENSKVEEKKDTVEKVVLNNDFTENKEENFIVKKENQIKTQNEEVVVQSSKFIDTIKTTEIKPPVLKPVLEFKNDTLNVALYKGDFKVINHRGHIFISYNEQFYSNKGEIISDVRVLKMFQFLKRTDKSTHMVDLVNRKISNIPIYTIDLDKLESFNEH